MMHLLADSVPVNDEHLAVGIAAILIIGIAAQWLAWKLRLPAILLLLAAGITVGPGWQFALHHKLINPDYLFGPLIAPMVAMSVAIVLFEGGLTLNLADLRHSGQVLWRLISVGAIITGLVASIAGVLILNLPVGLAVLLGAVLVVTGPTVIGPMLRFVRPTGKVGAILKWEGIVIDPIGAVLALLVFECIGAQHMAHGIPFTITLALTKTIGFGTFFGFAAAAILTLTFRNFWIADQLQVPLTLMLVIASFTASNLLQPESGLLAVTVMGVALANQKYVPVAHILEFKESLSVLLIGTLFVVLGARLDSQQISAVGWRSFFFVLSLILIARPLAVWASTLGTKLPFKSRIFLAWMAPRGIVAAAVASIFSLRLRQQGVAGAEILLPTTFAVIVGTVCVYGLSAAWAARRLGLSDPNNRGFLIAGANPVAREIAAALKEANQEVLLVDTNRENISAARMAGLNTFQGNILSDQLLRRIEGSAIGRLLALTPSQDVNSLAAVHFARHFGRSQVYQLPLAQRAGDHKSKTKADVSHELRGRAVFDPSLNFETIDQQLSQGTLKRTLLTSEFGFENLASQLAEKIVPLFVIDPTGELHVRTAEDQTTPHAGQAVITIAPKKTTASN